MIRKSNLLQARTLVLGIAVSVAVAMAGCASTALAKGPKGHKGYAYSSEHGHHHGHAVKVVDLNPAGTLRVHNPTDFRFALALDGRHVGKVAPGSSLIVANVGSGTHQLQAHLLGMPNAPNQLLSVFVAPGQPTTMTLSAPVASLVVRNKQAVTVHLHIDGQARATLVPGAKVVIDGLLAGTHRVELMGPYGLVAGRQMMLQPGEREKWAPPPALGSVAVRNAAHRPVVVTLGPGRSAQIAPGGVANFSGLPVGTQTVRVTGKHGHSVTAQIAVHPNETTAWTFVPPAPKKGTIGYGSGQVAWVY